MVHFGENFQVDPFMCCDNRSITMRLFAFVTSYALVGITIQYLYSMIISLKQVIGTVSQHVMYAVLVRTAMTSVENYLNFISRPNYTFYFHFSNTLSNAEIVCQTLYSNYCCSVMSTRT